MARVKEHIRSLRAYTPGIQPKAGEQVIKLNTNENPYPPSPLVMHAIAQECKDRLRYYPDPTSTTLRKAISSIFNVPPECVLCGNGSDEILRILLATFTEKGDRIGYYQPSYSYYATLGSIHNLTLVPTPLGKDLTRPPFPNLANLSLFFLTNPNSPLGFSLTPEYVAKIARHLKGILVVDEAYADFARWNCLHLLKTCPNIIITRSLSKSYSLAGLRVGFALGAARWIRHMDKVRDHYNLSRVAQAAACAALTDRSHFEQNVQKVLRTRDRVSQALRAMGYEVLPSEANFLFVRPKGTRSARTIYQRLFRSGILVRYFDQPGLRDGLRITIGTDTEMDTLLAHLKTY